MTSVSTHVLDTTTGRPATGVRVRLETQRDGRVIASAKTDADGRIKELGRDLEPGTCASVEQTSKDATSSFCAQVTLDVELGDGHTHVPLLLSRYGITSYRGS